MEYSDKNEHLNGDPIENTKNANNAPTGSEIDPSQAPPPDKNDEAPGKSKEDAIADAGPPSKSTPPENNEPVKEETSRDKENTSSAGNEGTQEAPSSKTKTTPKAQAEKSKGETTPNHRKEAAPEKEQISDPEKGEASAPEEVEAPDPGTVKEKAHRPEEEAEDKEKQEEKVQEPSAEKPEKEHPEKTEKKHQKKNEEEHPEKTEKKHQKKNEEEHPEKTEKKHQEKNEKEQPEKPDKETQEKQKEEEKINFELLSKTDLVKLLQDLLNHKTFDQLRHSVDEIQKVFQKKVEQEYAEKKEKFIDDGGLEQDFKPVEDPVDKQMEELLEKFKVLKSDFNKQLEAEKEINLKTKEEILEEFRLLMEGQEGFDSTFRKFKQLQKRWFDVGIVPKQNVRDLWNSYNFFVDKFNDYVRINKELRVLDLKKNLDLKLNLCEKAEELAEEKNISNAFKILQKYHAQWREIGPVPREDKDIIWERFKAATSVINKAHQQFQSELKDSLVENLEKKIVLCEKAEAIAVLDLNKHSDWVQKTNELLSIQKEWKTIGYAPKKDNNQIYARFRRACDAFFDRKASFYAKTFEHQKENMEKKQEIIQLAEELKESKDWKSTTDKLIDLQKQWKETGPVPRKESDKLWKRFRSACDHFFNAKSEFFGGKNESYEHNLEEKKALIAEMNQFKPPENRSKVMSALEEFQSRYNNIGFVPVEVKDKVRDDFKNAVNEIIDKTDATEEEKYLMRYRIRITAIMNSPRSENKIRFERDKLMNKLQQLRNDIGVWENNIGFFKQTESSEDTLSEFNEKIEEAHNRINQLEQKIRIIDELDN